MFEKPIISGAFLIECGNANGLDELILISIQPVAGSILQLSKQAKFRDLCLLSFWPARSLVGGRLKGLPLSKHLSIGLRQEVTARFATSPSMLLTSPGRTSGK